MSSAAVDPAPASRAAPRPARHRARLWWRVHQWAGLQLSLLLSFILLTGTLATLSYEMDWLLRPALRVSPATVAGPPDWVAIARSIDAAYPQHAVHWIEAPLASAFAAPVMAEDADGATRWLYAHPTTGAIQGEGSTITAQLVLRQMHRHLNLPTWIGVPLVSALSLLLMVSLVTSLMVYKKWWRGFLRRPRGRDGRTFWGDFHRLAGVWSLWFALLMAVTGVWYLAESTFAEAPAPPAPEAELAEAKPAAYADQLAAGLRAALAASPGLRIRGIRFPTGDDPVFVFEGQDRAILVRPRANTVWTAAEGGAVLAVNDARDLTIHQRIAEAADPLHFGTFGGYWTRIPWFLFGVLLTALSVSGVAIHAMRLAGDPSVRAGRLAAGAWRGMGLLAWPATALIVAALVLIALL